MPLRTAHYWLLGLLGCTLFAFWPTYLVDLPDGKPAWHVHAAGALLWVVLVIVQSWSIHGGHRDQHRKLGLASFALFPLFLIGGALAIKAEAMTLAADFTDPENADIGPFGFFDTVANVGFATLFYGGLKHRRNVQLHARYLVATTLFLVAPVIWRLLGEHVPFFASDTPETLHRFSYAMAAGNAGAIAITLYLYRQAPRYGRPFAIAAGFIAAQQVLFETLGRLEAWGELFSRFGSVPTSPLVVSTGVLSLAICWHGWISGRRADPPVGRATATA